MLAVAIGVNEAIVLQQLHYLLRNPDHGRKIEEHRWIFNTADQWVSRWFPFLSLNTLKRTFANLAAKRLVVTCQPEGRLSRRKYYRIDYEALGRLSIPDRPKMGQSNGSKWAVPNTKTTEQGLKETKETSEVSDVPLVSDFGAVNRTREQKRRYLRWPRFEIPSITAVEAYAEKNGWDKLMMCGRLQEAYETLYANKWHHWNKHHWMVVKFWGDYFQALEDKMNDAVG